MDEAGGGASLRPSRLRCFVAGKWAGQGVPRAQLCPSVVLGTGVGMAFVALGKGVGPLTLAGKALSVVVPAVPFRLSGSFRVCAGLLVQAAPKR